MAFHSCSDDECLSTQDRIRAHPCFATTHVSASILAVNLQVYFHLAVLLLHEDRLRMSAYCHTIRLRICLRSAHKLVLTKRASLWAAPVYWQWRRMTKASCPNVTKQLSSPHQSVLKIHSCARQSLHVNCIYLRCYSCPSTSACTLSWAAPFWS